MRIKPMTLIGRSLLSKVAAVFAIAATTLALTGVPAQADVNQKICSVLGGNEDERTHIKLCLEMRWGGSWDFETWSYVTVGDNLETSANGCKVTVYVDLKANGDPWSSGKKTRDCSRVVTTRVPDLYDHFRSDTSATWWRGHGCIDLYYHSNTSGWQRCYVTPWIPRPQGT